MALFFISTTDGQVATQRQLIDAGIVTGSDLPPAPWHRVSGTGDATTLWYAVMRKRTRGIFIGQLCVRHSDHHDLLLQGGWHEVPVSDIHAPGAASETAAVSPWPTGVAARDAPGGGGGPESGLEPGPA